MVEKKLSEELRHCLEDDGCRDCQHYKPETKFICKGLLRKAYEVVKRYEEMGEQGKLIELPCAVGDTVYYADNEYYFTVLPVKVDEISVMESNEILYKCLLFDGNGDVETQFDFDKDDFDKTVSLTRQEAEDKLAEMEGKK